MKSTFHGCLVKCAHTAPGLIFLQLLGAACAGSVTPLTRQKLLFVLMVWLEQHHCCPESAFTALQVPSTNGILPLSITTPSAGQGLLSAGTAAPAEQELLDPEQELLDPGQELSPAAPWSPMTSTAPRCLQNISLSCGS